VAIEYNPQSMGMLGLFMGSNEIADDIYSDEYGQFEYEGQFLNDTDVTTVSVRASYHLYDTVWSERFPIESGAKHKVELQFKQEPSLKGFVRDEAGNPIAQARLLFKSIKGRPNYYSQWSQSAISSDDGEYGVYLEPGDYHYFIKADNLTLDGQDNVITIQAKQTRTKNFTLKENSSSIYHITVVDDKRSPVVNAALYYNRYDKSNDHIHVTDSFIGNTDAEGKLEFDLYKHVSPRDNTGTIVKAIPPQYADLNPNQVQLNEEEHEVTIELESGKNNFATIKGRVVDLNKSPIPAYSIMLIPSEKLEVYHRKDSIYNTWIPVRSSDGSFSIENISMDVPSYSLVAREGENYAKSPPISLIPHQVVSGIQIVMQESIKIVGKVVDAETKQPVEGVKVIPQLITNFVNQHQSGRNKFLHRRGLNFGNQTNLVSSMEQGITDSQGIFRMNNVPNSHMNLYFVKDKYGHKFISITPKKSQMDIGTIEINQTGQWRRRISRD